MNLKIIFSFCAALFLLVGCGQDLDTPEKLVSTLENIVIQENTKDIMRVIYLPDSISAERAAQVKESLENNVRYEHQRLGGFQSMQLERITYNQDQSLATVDLLTGYKDGSTQVESGQLIKINGQWKIKFEF